MTAAASGAGWYAVLARTGLAAKGVSFGIVGALAIDLTASAVKILLGSAEQQSQNGKAHKTTALVLAWPGGTWIVGFAGAVIVGVGVWNAYRGLTRKFEKEWHTGRMGAQARSWGGRAGLAGHLARAVVFALIGVFVTRAALQYDPRESIGLDGRYTSSPRRATGLTCSG